MDTDHAERRTEIVRLETRMREDIQALVDREEFPGACQYQVPATDKKWLSEAGEQVRDRLIRELVYPKWIASCERKMGQTVAGLVKSAQFGKAREFLWQHGKTGVGEVDRPVERSRYRLLTEDVNAAEFEYAKKRMSDAYAKAVLGNTIGDFLAAKKTVMEYPRVRYYSEILDGKLDAVRDELVAVHVPREKMPVIMEKTREEIARCFADGRADFKDGEGPDLTMSKERLAEFRGTLVRCGCTAAQADAVTSAFESAVKPLLDAAIREAKGAPSATALGTSTMSERLEAFRAELVGRITRDAVMLLSKAFVTSVSGLVARGDYAKARELALASQPTGDLDIDRGFFSVRMGVLNKIVNPKQCESIISEMERRVDELVRRGEYDEAYVYIGTVKSIDDARYFALLTEALDGVRQSMTGLQIKDAVADKYIQEVKAQVRARLDDRKGDYEPDRRRDLIALHTALKKYERGVMDQFYDHDIAREAMQDVRSGVLRLMKSGERSMTTLEVKDEIRRKKRVLRDRIMPYQRKDRERKQRENESDAWDMLEGRIDKDAQIALAERGSGRKGRYERRARRLYPRHAPVEDSRFGIHPVR